MGVNYDLLMPADRITRAQTVAMAVRYQTDGRLTQEFPQE